MSWHVYLISRVLALCALFSLHSALIGIIAGGMLRFAVGALQFSMDVVALFTILCFSVLECTRRNTGPSRILNLFAFSVLFVLSLVGAVGLSVRGASQQGKGLCEDFASEHPENCTKATIAVTITWISVVIALAGLIVSWLDKSSRMTMSDGPYGRERPEKDPEEPEQYEQHEQHEQHERSRWSFRSSRSHIAGPTPSYIPRPRDPYDPPRRRRSDRSQSHQTGPRRAPSNRAPVHPLPALPSFNPLELEGDEVAASMIDHGQGRRSRSSRRVYKDLPEPPPPTRRPPKDSHTREVRRMKHLSPTDLFAQMG